MRNCRVCGLPKVTTRTGPATCPECRRLKYLIVKKRYQQSSKGKATARAREQRPDVKEKRRQFSRSEQGRENKGKYEATPKGQTTRKRAIAKYHMSEKGKAKVAQRHQLTKHDPKRIAQKQAADCRYRKTNKGKARKYRDYARRKAALVPERPVSAEDWQEILQAHKYRCHYCHKKKILTIDHVIPLSKGGKHVKENIVPACRNCNGAKRDRIIRLL